MRWVRRVLVSNLGRFQSQGVKRGPAPQALGTEATLRLLHPCAHSFVIPLDFLVKNNTYTIIPSANKRKQESLGLWQHPCRRVRGLTSLPATLASWPRGQRCSEQTSLARPSHPHGDLCCLGDCPTPWGLQHSLVGPGRQAAGSWTRSAATRFRSAVGQGPQ